MRPTKERQPLDPQPFVAQPFVAQNSSPLSPFPQRSTLRLPESLTRSLDFGHLMWCDTVHSTKPYARGLVNEGRLDNMWDPSIFPAFNIC